MSNEEYGRTPLKVSRNPYTCGISGKTFTALEVTHRVKHLAKAIAKETGWEPNGGTPWDKVACIFSLNTVSYFKHGNSLSFTGD